MGVGGDVHVSFLHTLLFSRENPASWIVSLASTLQTVPQLYCFVVKIGGALVVLLCSEAFIFNTVESGI